MEGNEGGKENPQEMVMNFGGAAFRKDKLVGFLDRTEARGANWVRGEVKSGVVIVPAIIDKNRRISMEIIKTWADIRPSIDDGKIKFTIEVNAVGDMVENQDAPKPMDHTEYLNYFLEVENKFKSGIEQEVRAAADKAQDELQSDILGFGDALGRKYPKEWKELKDKWGELFPQVEYDVNVIVTLERPGLILKPFEPKE